MQPWDRIDMLDSTLWGLESNQGDKLVCPTNKKLQVGITNKKERTRELRILTWELSWPELSRKVTLEARSEK